QGPCRAGRCPRCGTGSPWPVPRATDPSQEKAMRRALGRAGWALAAAGGLGMVQPAVAQTYPIVPQARGGQVRYQQPGSSYRVPGPTAAASGRAAEVQVELAGMACPMTFPGRLAAHAAG